ncbi:hypothetical protein E2P81_ATG05636 [Venturia nashicola]|nr:hypothetical protein E2P81_ATG05636 [Venturia nashicola]
MALILHHLEIATTPQAVSIFSYAVKLTSRGPWSQSVEATEYKNELLSSNRAEVGQIYPRISPSILQQLTQRIMKLFTILLTASASLVQCQYEGGADPLSYESMSAPEAITLLAGECKTMTSCYQEYGTKTITYITTTIPGVYPTTTQTIPGNPNVVGGVTTIYIINPTPTTIYVTSTVTPGQVVIPPSRDPEPGQPGTVWVFPPGSPPTKTVTITTSIPNINIQHPMTIPGRPPVSVGAVATVVVIFPTDAPNDLRPPEWSCPCDAASTITITNTQAAQIVPDVTTTDAQGYPTTKPASKYPCSGDDKHPCRGKLISGWQKFTLGWNAKYPRNGPPAPFIKEINVEQDDAILTVTDDENKAEHFEIKLDGEILGETEEKGFDRRQHCGKDADACIARGWSHGSFPVPKVD